MSGNYYMGSSPYLTFTLDGSDADLANMSASLWAVNTHSTTVYNNIKNASGASEAVKNATMGECLTWKAMAYFYMVRSFGAVPIIHMPVETINSQQSTSLRKAKISNIYDYIIILLEQAITLLPDSDPTKNGRIDKYAAKALLAKVYLTKAGFSEENTTYNPGTYSYITCTAHQRNAADLAKAAELALDVIENSGRKLMDNYSDIFRGENNVCDEALISWAWTMGSHWTCQNSFHCDLSIEGFDENGDCWGGWGGPSVDLQDAFDENALSPDRQNIDARRKATLMMINDEYDYFYADCGGFELLKFCYNGYKDDGHPGPDQWESPTGAGEVKHLYGDNADHINGVGYSSARMANSLSTPLLRLSDVMLVLAEAKVILSNPTSPLTASTTDAEALQAINNVRQRAGLVALTSVSFEDIWKERRLELAFEGDRWYDYVRVSYYNSDFCVNDLKAQTRIAIGNGTLNDIYENYYRTGDWVVSDATKQAFEESKKREAAPMVEQLLVDDSDTGKKYFAIPMTERDVVFNPNLAASAEAVHVDVRTTYSY